MYFLRLIRPINLIIIVLTMYGTLFYLEMVSSDKFRAYSHFDFAILVFSTLLIASAGNIINDYFDIKADRINCPERLIITKHMSRRAAIFWHWLFNSIGFVIGIYLSIKYHTLSFVFVQLVSINFLWFYSMYFKRKMLIGNLIISFLTAMIPILTLIFYVFSGVREMEYMNSYTFIFFMAGFAFLLNFAREIVKDIEDIEGDKQIQVRSLPMIIGAQNSLYIVALMLAALPVLLVFLWFKSTTSLSALHLAGLADFIALVLIFTSPNRLKEIDRLIKLTMFFGLLLFYQLAFL